MPKKGSVNNPHGRPKGSENKSTTELKQTVANFVANNAEKFAGWLDKIEQDNGPLEAFKRVEALLEYALPKQARIDATLSGPDGGAIQHKMTVEFVDAPSNTESV